jgi:nitroreductase/NAD-dependent dihydropyrimidine dehydrogenase PreA subunit
MPQILVDKSLCTKCNICSTVCVLRIIERSGETGFPVIADENVKICFICGHCEAFCPQNALTLDFRLEEKKKSAETDVTAGTNDIVPYLKQRRSIRNYSSKVVPKEVIAQLLDVTRYAPSGGNNQNVRWLVFQDPADVRKIASLTVDWMRTLLNTEHPLSAYVQDIISSWDRGGDPVCRNAPHILFAHVPFFGQNYDPTDGIIAMAHLDIAAPSFGLGTCWAGFVKMAADQYQPLQEFLALPANRRAVYAMILGYPSYKVRSIPRRNPVKISWR